MGCGRIPYIYGGHTVVDYSPPGLLSMQDWGTG